MGIYIYPCEIILFKRFMKYFVSFFIIIFAALIIFVAVTAILPSEINITRVIMINAKPHRVFELTYSLKQWEKWSPWFNMDKKGSWKYYGSANGVGSYATWKSKNQALGSGSMRISKCRQDSLITVKFLLPGEKECVNTIFLSGRGLSTKVKWVLNLKFSFFERWLNFGTDKFISNVIESGLKKLKRTAESIAAEDAKRDA